MSALFPEQTRTMREATSVSSSRAIKKAGGWGGLPPESDFAGKWRQVHRRAAELAALAQLSPEKFEGALAAFPDRIGEAPARQRELAWQGLEDIEAMMEPGLAALETLRRRGTTTTAPALALWREFYGARRSIMALAAA
jgi:hypothetical protein